MGYCCRPKTVPCRVRCVCKRTVVLLSTYYCMCNSKSMATARLVALLSTALTTSVQRGARRAAWSGRRRRRRARGCPDTPRFVASKSMASSQTSRAAEQRSQKVRR